MRSVAEILNQVLPGIMVALNLAAATSNALVGDLRTSGYWFSAATLNYCAANFPLPRLPWRR